MITNSEIHGKYTIEQVHSLFKQWEKEYWEPMSYTPAKLKKKTVIFDGVPVGVYSQRYELFLQNIKCVKCGLEGTHYVLEKAQKSHRYHFNLYHDNILFTKDHIMPKSRGGHDWLENYQTMCYPCNHDKSNKVELWQLM